MNDAIKFADVSIEAAIGKAEIMDNLKGMTCEQVYKIQMINHRSFDLYAKEQASTIRQCVNDPELARKKKKQLMLDFIQHVAAGQYGELSEIAQIVSAAQDIELPW